MNTTTEETTIQTLAQKAYDALETRTRNDGTNYICRKDDAPDWVESLCMKAHGDMLPDDYRYNFIESALGIIAEEDDEDDYSSAIDNAVDCYNGRLAAWLASSVERGSYVDDAIEEFGGYDKDRGIYHALAIGQYAERSEVLTLCLSFLRDRLEEIEADAE